MRVAFYTLGCKVNQYETEVLSARFAAEGFDVVPGHAPGCDVYVVGSCTVTAEGDRKTRQAVRRFRRENPGAIVVLTGCYPQAFPREAAAVQEADIITGARNRAALPQLVRQGGTVACRPAAAGAGVLSRPSAYCQHPAARKRRGLRGLLRRRFWRAHPRLPQNSGWLR